MGAPAGDQRRAVRDTVVAALERRLPYARFEMLVIVGATGLVGFGASVWLLHDGVSSMARRYSMAALVAYGAFLLLLRLWAERQRRELGPWTPPNEALRTREPGPVDPDPFEDWSPSGLNAYGVAHLVRLIPALVVVAVICSWIMVVAYVVWITPVLLADVLLDVLLVTGLYRGLRSLEPESWLRTAVRRTWKPAVVVVLLLAAFGFVVQAALPQADSIGDVLRH